MTPRQIWLRLGASLLALGLAAVAWVVVITLLRDTI